MRETIEEQATDLLLLLLNLSHPGSWQNYCDNGAGEIVAFGVEKGLLLKISTNDLKHPSRPKEGEAGHQLIEGGQFYFLVLTKEGKSVVESLQADLRKTDAHDKLVHLFIPEMA